MAFHANHAPAVVNAGAQVKMQIVLRCDAPFEAVYPAFSVSFVPTVTNRTHTVPLRLPIALVKFCEPLSVDGAHWFQQWQSAGPGRTDIFKSLHDVNVEHLEQLFMTGFRFAVLKVRSGQVETVGNNVWGRASTRTLTTSSRPPR